MEIPPHELVVFANLQPSTIDMVQEFQKKLDETFEGAQRQMIEEALLLMCEVHADQEARSDGAPYVEHPLRVANNVFDSLEKPDYEIVIAALLHDSVEDQALRLALKLTYDGMSEDTKEQSALQYVSARFGNRVAQIVASLTNPDFEMMLANEGRENTRENRNELYVLHVAEVIEDPGVLPVKLFDFAENALPLETVTDPARRLTLTRKYIQVVHVFIDRLVRGDHNMKQEKVDALFEKFKDTYSRMQSYIHQAI